MNEYVAPNRIFNFHSWKNGQAAVNEMVRYVFNVSESGFGIARSQKTMELERNADNMQPRDAQSRTFDRWSNPQHAPWRPEPGGSRMVIVYGDGEFRSSFPGRRGSPNAKVKDQIARFAARINRAVGERKVVLLSIGEQFSSKTSSCFPSHLYGPRDAYPVLPPPPGIQIPPQPPRSNHRVTELLPHCHKVVRCSDPQCLHGGHSNHTIWHSDVNGVRNLAHKYFALRRRRPILFYNI